MDNYIELLNKYEKLKEENIRLRAEYAMLQNASDEYEDRLLETIDKAILFLENEYDTYPSPKEWRDALLSVLKKIS